MTDGHGQRDVQPDIRVDSFQGGMHGSFEVQVIPFILPCPLSDWTGGWNLAGSVEKIPGDDLPFRFVLF